MKIKVDSSRKERWLTLTRRMKTERLEILKDRDREKGRETERQRSRRQISHTLKEEISMKQSIQKIKQIDRLVNFEKLE